MVSGLEDPSTVRLTLIDFGYADVKCGGTDLTRLAGSPEYAAPEVLSWLAEQGDPYDARCDVWSVGITAHVLVSASPSRRHITRAALRVSDQWVVPAAPPLLPIRRPSLCIDPPTRARPTALHPPPAYPSLCIIPSRLFSRCSQISGELPFEVPEDADEDAIADIARSATLNFEQERADPHLG